MSYLEIYKDLQHPQNSEICCKPQVHSEQPNKCYNIHKLEVAE